MGLDFGEYFRMMLKRIVKGLGEKFQIQNLFFYFFLLQLFCFLSRYINIRFIYVIKDEKVSKSFRIKIGFRINERRGIEKSLMEYSFKIKVRFFKQVG